MFGFGSKGKEEKSSNSNSVTTTQLCRVCKRSCFFHRFQHQKTEVSVCATCYFEGKIAPDTKHDEYQEIGSALSVYCGLCGAICNTHYFMSKGQPLEIQAGKLHKEGIRTLCPLCQGRASTSVDTLPENFTEEKEMWPIIKSGSLDDFEEKGLQKNSTPKVIMSFGSAGGMFEKMYSIVNWLRNTLRWDQQEIWIDREQIWRHPDWQQKYQNALKESPVIIFMLSMAWVNSKYCLQELEWWQSLPHKEKPTAMVCILEHEVLQTEQFKEIAKILWKDVAWNDVVKFKLSDIIDLSVIGGRETLAAKLNFLFPDMERFVDQGKHALKSGIQSMVDATITGFQKLSWSNNS